MKIIANNKKAYFDFEIIKTYEAGIILTGSEVKALRAGKVTMAGAFCDITKHLELYLRDMKIGFIKENLAKFQHKEVSARKLLLHKAEIIQIKQKVFEKGLTLIPLKIYFSQALVKVEIGLCRGKNLRDKRQTIKEHDLKRENAKFKLKV